MHKQNTILPSFLGTMTAALFPRRCPVCHRVAEQNQRRNLKICPACYEKLTFVGEHFCMCCGRRMTDPGEEFCQNCKKHRFSFERGLVLLDYDDLTRDSMAAIKYKGKREYLDFYGEEAVKRLGEEIRAMHLDGLVPVPVHRKRKIKRGYNQAAVLARVIGRAMDLPVYEDALLRRENTQALKELGAAQRRKNLAHAMRLGTLPEKREALMIVDDIFTTGSTVETCAGLLRDGGVKRVYSLCLCARPDIN